jgi:predicted RNA methylase
MTPESKIEKEIDRQIHLLLRETKFLAFHPSDPDDQTLWGQIFQYLHRNYKELFPDQSLPSVSYDPFFPKDPLGVIYTYFLNHRIRRIGSEWELEKIAVADRPSGKVYTPFPIVSYICRRVCEHWLSLNETKNQFPTTIADLACGTGRFLAEWLLLSPEYFQNQSNPQPQLFGFDTDRTAIDLAHHNPLFQGKIGSHICLTVKDVLIEDIPERFDIIIGNPPYIESRAIPDPYWQQLRDQYTCAYKKFDLSTVFLERIVHLLNPNGITGLIITNKWMVSDYGKKIRELLLKRMHLLEIVDLAEANIFPGVSTYPIVLIMQKIGDSTKKKKSSSRVLNIYHCATINAIATIDRNPPLSINQQIYANFPDTLISLNLDPLRLRLFEQIQSLLPDQCVLLGNCLNRYYLRDGIHTGNIRSKLISKTPPPNDLRYRKLITSRNCVERYRIQWGGDWICYDPAIIETKEKEYASLREPWIFNTKPKIVIKLFGKELTAALDAEGLYTNNSLSVLGILPGHNSEISLFTDVFEELRYILGVLNSKVVHTYYTLLFGHTHVRGKYLQFYLKDLLRIPLPRICEHNIQIAKTIAASVAQLENLIATNPTKKNAVALKALTEKIDSLVASLYGLDVIPDK